MHQSNGSVKVPPEIEQNASSLFLMFYDIYLTDEQRTELNEYVLQYGFPSALLNPRMAHIFSGWEDFMEGWRGV